MGKAKKIISEYFIIALGSFILAFAINFFLVPLKLSTGGVSGVATILYHLFDIPLSATNLLINIVLFVFGYRMLDKSSIAKTVVGIVFLSLFLEVTSLFGVYTEDMLIASVFGGVIVGIGVGLVVFKEASTGGSDFAALMIHKFIPHISLATIILIIDFAVVAVTGIVFKNYTIIFYSIISLYISSKVTDWILVRGDFAKSVYVISGYNDDIASNVMLNMERGVTGIYSKGIYSDNNMTMLMCVVKSKEIPQLMKIIKSYDKDAFVIVSDVREVHGLGFKEN